METRAKRKFHSLIKRSFEDKNTSGIVRPRLNLLSANDLEEVVLTVKETNFFVVHCKH